MKLRRHPLTWQSQPPFIETHADNDNNNDNDNDNTNDNVGGSGGEEALVATP